ncbi:hypothetical protein [uncultured Enterococcus sp.]|uniref:hypothetical protein n=1 Tax=uncultured Enterococcus sp. TaxID=167972 RepID=UPI002AA6929A|nr:hypothetical protein [uncultured Enterococcus sp.]
MEFELFLFSNRDYCEMIDMVEQIFTNFYGGKVKIIKSEDEFYIGTKYFSFSIEQDDKSDIEFVKKNYDIKVNEYITIEVFNKTFDDGILEALKVMKVLLDGSTNALFLEIGDRQLFRKEDGQLWINTDLEDYQKEYLTPATLESLSNNYKLKKMEMI